VEKMRVTNMAEKKKKTSAITANPRASYKIAPQDNYGKKNN